MSPTQRTLAECRKRGWDADIVERRLRFNVTKDLLGCIDVVAVTPDGIIGIQATSGPHHAARVAKCKAEPRIAGWFRAGARLQVWSFAKRGKRGKAKRWQLRETEVVL